MSLVSLLTAMIQNREQLLKFNINSVQFEFILLSALEVGSPRHIDYKETSQTLWVETRGNHIDACPKRAMSAHHRIVLHLRSAGVCEYYREVSPCKNQQRSGKACSRTQRLRDWHKKGFL